MLIQTAAEKVTAGVHTMEELSEQNTTVWPPQRWTNHSASGYRSSHQNPTFAAASQFRVASHVGYGYIVG